MTRPMLQKEVGPSELVPRWQYGWYFDWIKDDDPLTFFDRNPQYPLINEMRPPIRITIRHSKPDAA